MSAAPPGAVGAAALGLEAATLASERQRASFDVDLLAALWLGSAEAVVAARKVQELLAKYPVFDRQDNYRLGKYERYTRICERVAELRRLRDSSGDVSSLNEEEFRMFTSAALPMGSNVDIHEAMFMPTIFLQGSDEQRQRWLPACQARAILGTYCQTEIGHGSDVSGLETTATYDGATQEFEIHTPTIRATKWWPKGVGRTMTHAVVFARLRLPQPDGTTKDHGVRGFLVQLRDANTGENLRGVRSGDIGPTIGAIDSEQGWVVFDRLRVPREALLARYVEVLPDGTFVKHGGAGAAKRGYSTMMKIRSEFAFISSIFLGRACTIAVRYLAVRRQFPKPGVPGEDTQVLDYQGVQMRVLPWISAAYALRFTGRRMLRVYNEAERRIAQGDDSLLAEAHALSAGLKATLTKIAADGIEELRRACGGHGYLNFSGLVELYGDMMLMFTGEGENYMIVQQLTRWLLKGGFRGSKGWAAFLSEEGSPTCEVKETSGWLDASAQLAALQCRARHKVQSTTGHVLAAVASGAKGMAAAAGAQWDGIEAAFAVCEALIAEAFVEGEATAYESLRPVLGRLRSLFCLSTLERGLADLILAQHLSAEQGAALRAQVRNLLVLIRPDAVALVDAFQFTDNELNSALGARDGNVYHRLLDWASQEPMNQDPVLNGWREHLQPMMEAGRRDLFQQTGLTLQETGLLQGSAAAKARL